MRILVACEYSGKVREAFRALGHDVTSCDLLPSDDNSLTHNELTKLINDGAIEGVKPEQINGASIDLTLGRAK